MRHGVSRTPTSPHRPGASCASDGYPMFRFRGRLLSQSCLAQTLWHAIQAVGLTKLAYARGRGRGRVCVCVCRVCGAVLCGAAVWVQ